MTRIRALLAILGVVAALTLTDASGTTDASGKTAGLEINGAAVGVRGFSVSVTTSSPIGPASPSAPDSPTTRTTPTRAVPTTAKMTSLAATGTSAPQLIWFGLAFALLGAATLLVIRRRPPRAH